MSRGRLVHVLPWILLGLDALLIVGAIALEIASRVGDEDAYFIYVGIGLVIGYGGVGALIATRQPTNAIGWLFCGVAVVFGLTAFADEYVGLAVTPASSLPLAIPLAWLQSWTLVLALEAVPLVLLLFPTGSPPSRRWQPLAWAIAALTFISVAGVILGTGDLEAQGSFRLPNPTAIRSIPELRGVLLTIGGVGSLVASIASLVALIVRFRRSTGDERQQIRWLAYVGLAMLVLFIASVASQQIVGLNNVLFFVFFLIVAVGIPAAAGVAILRYHLYDIDLVINRTIVYGTVAVVITSAYVAVVVGLGALTTDSLAWSVVATAVVALLFQPVRTRAQRLANRLVYGSRATPYESLTRLSDRVGGAYATEDVLPRTARVIAEGTGAERAVVWLRVGRELRPAVSWPSDAEPLEPMAVDGRGTLPSLPGSDHAIPVIYRDELLGALAVKEARGTPIRPDEERLLEDLAGQAGIVLSNVRLTAELEEQLRELAGQAAELRLSQQRLVAAQDEERRRLERNIHDGAQQHLVALAVKLRLARSLVSRDAVKATALIEQLRGQVDDALRTLGSLALGIYPPLLEERGIAAAVAAQLGSSDLPVTIEGDVLLRHPIEREAAIYFCIQEALQNAAKHARASAVVVRLTDSGAELTFEVRDDGVGFDPSSNGEGTGLKGMRDRLSVFGGAISVESAPGRGTVLRGRVPVEHVEAPA